MPFSRMSPCGAARPQNANQSPQHHQHRISDQLMLIMTIGLLPDAMKPGIHCARTHWIQGFMTFQLARSIRTAMLMVPMCPESDF
jgi:hypothetical protein